MLGYFSFQRYILPNVKTAAIQEKGAQQPAHTAIAIIEGVYAEEIMDKDRDGNKWLYFCIANHTIILCTDSVQCLRRLKRGQRGE